MNRRCLMALALALITGMMGFAQNPPTDPDAKGTVGVSVAQITNGAVTITVTRSATAGWSFSDVTPFAVPKNGGIVYGDVSIAWLSGDDGKPVPSMTFTMTLPNGDYDLWCVASLTDGGTGSQTIGSAIASATVTQGAAAPLAGGVIAFGSGSPARQQGGAAFSATGTFGASVGWSHSAPPNNVINVYSIPTSGGLIRQRSVIGNKVNTPWTWSTSPDVIYVPSSLSYNLLATTMFTNGMVGQAIGTGWAKNK